MLVMFPDIQKKDDPTVYKYGVPTQGKDAEDFANMLNGQSEMKYRTQLVKHEGGIYPEMDQKWQK